MGQGFAELAGSLTTADRLALISELLHVGASSQIEPVSSGRGFVFYDGTGYAGGRVTDTCTSYLFMSGLNLLDYRMLAVFYLLAMCYIFVGIAIISDVFMGAIERITSQTREKLVTDREGRTSYVVTQVWNPTVANLTLMALGSSAPEIVLAIYGTVVTLDSTPDILGPATIVGSAAYNMFVIIGICIMSLPDTHTRRTRTRAHAHTKKTKPVTINY
ncbi:Sodium/calcium exchanger protein-domain-containing protein [Pavlovales sp. CCMP2436]|nr:Sodium/calcium exchanger protein-domain-containing protein [Pavlovales sp. CCMP2436]|mmetsp:Transcript_48498/g.113489  ORF Transcript_48498/g.113489 Transcript_48498/m.113489 type:complete len:217 (+) Transcript_48498:112-762(+)